ncbi:DUF2797 domain-containing protein [Williamwhitmania taraxaci]|uniref:DUF2797 domain-containing protein n=1 Tax=Williamwhitmania taraxaci TaxID=1640674 RepID=A0A1G6H833_9BACT|nr:DUF2797 domain-containing protein [Williamwhitmania taraxaci]SDB90248.1 Protein of unknown function [Williamwhitmania taraxaci]
MSSVGVLRKMKVAYAVGDPQVNYTLVLDNEDIPMNRLLGTAIRLSWTNRILCLNCGKTTKKSFGQGYCYPCFIKIPETEACVLRPELCRAHLGEARNMQWAEQHCLADHYVYLAVSGGLKVGVTRKSQIPIRWIDQGASRAVRIAQLPNRFLAGSLEVALKAYFSDKTDWRKMLRGVEPEEIDLAGQRTLSRELFPQNLLDYFLPSDEIYEINYPVLEYPTILNSVNLEKVGIVEGVLTGIRGQYIMLDKQRVMNIRTFSGYEIIFEKVDL